MHHRVLGPPAVRYPAGRTLRLKWILLGLWLPGAALSLYAVGSGTLTPAVAPSFLALAALLLVALGLGVFWRRQEEWLLHWDGLRWRLSPGATGLPSTDLCQVDVRLDLQSVLLLRGRAAGSRRGIWLWAERRDTPERWHLLRCALYGAPLTGPEGLQAGGAVEEPA